MRACMRASCVRADMIVCVYEHACAHVYVCNVCMCGCVGPYVHARIHMCAHVHMCAFTRRCAHVRVRLRVLAHRHACMLVFWSVCECACACVRLCLCTCMHMCMHLFVVPDLLFEFLKQALLLLHLVIAGLDLGTGQLQVA